MKSVLFPNSVFSILIFLYSVLMVKLNFINQKACLINWVLQFYLYQILFSIIFWIPFNGSINFFFLLIFSFSEILHIYIFLLNKFW